MPDPTNITAAFDARMALVRARVLAYIGRAWGTLDNWRDDDIARFVKLITPTVEGGQAQIATFTDAYLAAYLTATGVRTAPVGIPARSVTTLELRGVTTAEAFSRAGVTTRMAISEGVPLSEAARRGLDRAQQIAATDLQLAKTHTAQRIMGSNRRVVGYRRVLHGKSCKLCGDAARQRYHSKALMPIHPGCDCGVAPIVGTHDPGREIEAETVPTVVQQHGEIGPTLAVAGQHFDTA